MHLPENARVGMDSASLLSGFNGLDEIAQGFRAFIQARESSSVEELLEDDRHSFVIESLLSYLMDNEGFSGSEADYYNPNNRYEYTLLPVDVNNKFKLLT